MKASDIPDDDVVEFVAEEGLRPTDYWPERHLQPQEYRWVTIGRIEERFFQFPSKVVLAKLRALVKKGKLGGCACGCRGDFHIPL